MSQQKLIIVSAPSGAGKTTLVKHLLSKVKALEFSVSATSRKAREGEVDGKNYYFISPEEFQNKIKNNEFVEWEEVYKGTYYGTLASELERIWNNDNVVIFDVDVYGGLNLKELFGNKALSIFINVPSVVELEKRLRSRATESNEAIEMRIKKAMQEIGTKDNFDVIILNDNLEKAQQEIVDLVQAFIKKKA